MKNIRHILFSLIGCLLLAPTVVLAAGTATISGASSVEKGSNVTVSVTVKNTAAWNLKLSGSGATSGCSNTVADVTANGQNTTKTFSVTCKATSVGTIKFTVAGDITSADGTNSNVSLTKSVTVTEPRQKESESRLNSLKVEGYDINFSKDKKTYSIIVEPTVDSIKISASSISKYATVSGIGTKEISSDDNKFIVTCTSETGAKTEYVINVSVKDDNPINALIDGENYTVVKNNKSLTPPTNYKETTITIGSFEVPAYTNEITNLTIVGVKDSQGNIKYAVYTNGEYSLYNENKSDYLLLYIAEKTLEGYDKITVKINEVEYSAYKINDRFSILYAMDINTGDYNYYKYDSEQNTFQLFEQPTEINAPKDGFNIFIISTIILAITTVSLIGYVVILKSKIRKK